MAKKNYEEMSRQILALVGGKENLAQLAHCVTRLRIAVKDKGLVQDDKIKAVSGVVGTQWLGDQYQIIIGTDVEQLYPVVCAAAGMREETAIAENLDREKKPFRLKDVGNRILGYLSPTMNGIIPIMMAACMCKTLAVVLGPGMLNLVAAESDLAIVLDFMYDAFFYFIPLFLGYSAARVLNITPIYGIYLGALIMAPDFLALVGVRDSLSVFGIPAPVANYASSFLPVILGVWILSYVLKLLNRYRCAQDDLCAPAGGDHHGPRDVCGLRTSRYLYRQCGRQLLYCHVSVQRGGLYPCRRDSGGAAALYGADRYARRAGELCHSDLRQ